MKPFKEKDKHKKKYHHFVLEEIVDFTLDGVLGLLWRLVVGFFHLLGRLIIAIFHNIF
ncbi:MAG: hypothetical protein Q8934_10120 [Bacillota bacterium]|nr:hypothetical protein [Bacillota bacterium]